MSQVITHAPFIPGETVVVAGANGDPETCKVVAVEEDHVEHTFKLTVAGRLPRPKPYEREEY